MCLIHKFLEDFSAYRNSLLAVFIQIKICTNFKTSYKYKNVKKTYWSMAVYCTERLQRNSLRNLLLHPVALGCYISYFGFVFRFHMELNNSHTPILTSCHWRILNIYLPFRRLPHKMVKHIQTIRRQIADKLFECVWLFCRVAA